eukprot:m.20685 g.20685  ORF g.20685 m.20685 type:complete len:491 (-) comp6230_c0_seq1:49-1521(-)
MATTTASFVLLLVVLAAVAPGSAFRLGRPRGGLVPPPQTNTDTVASAPILWFNQTLDHSNPQDTTKWKQQYMYNTTHWDKDVGPVFLLLGGEGPASPAWISHKTAIMDYAERFGAVVVQLEHRFYGKSQPFADLSTEHLRYLTSEQALADVATFLPWFKTQLGAPDADVVVFGGSYSGALAAWLRQKYPHLVRGAVATSAPVLAKLNFAEYHEVVSNSLLQAVNGKQCVENIGAAMTKVDSMLKASADSRAQLVTKFKTKCTSDLSSSNDQMNFLSALVGNFDGVVQYNKDNRGFEGGTPPPTIDTLCNIMTAGSDPLTQLVAVNTFMLNQSSQTCFDVSYDNMIAELKNASLDGPASEGGRQWTYQTCTEFGYYQTSDSKQQVFGTGFPIDFFVQQCVDIYGLPGPNTQWTNENYGGLVERGTDILFVNGDIDPWHALSVLQYLSPTVTSIYIHGTAHCANMYPPSPKDLPGLTAARVKIQETISVWLE